MKILHYILVGTKTVFSGYFRLLGSVPKWSAAGIVALTLGVVGYGGAVALDWTAGLIDTMPGNTYAEGWQMGQMTHYTVDGPPGFRTGEMEVLYGVNASAGSLKRNGTVVFSSPGSLSSPTVDPAQRGLVGDYVAIHYRTLKGKITSFNGHSDTRVMDMVPVTPKAIPTACGDTSESEASLRRDTSKVGYLVDVSYGTGNVIGTREAVLQIGNASGTFFEVSIGDSDILDCAVKFLQSGTRVKLHYRTVMVRNVLDAATSLSLVGISPSPSNL